MTKRDYYQILGVDRKASPNEIRMAYRKLAFKFHPDRNREQSEAAMRMKEINESYAIISDKTKRAQYDAVQQSYDHTAHDHFREKYSEQDIYRGSDIHHIFEEFSKTFGLRGFDEIFREAYGPGFQSSQDKKSHAPSGANDRGSHAFGAMANPFRGTLGKLLRYFLKKTFGLRWPERGKDLYDTILVDLKVAFLGGKIKFKDRREKRILVVTIPAKVSHGQRIRLKGMGAHGKNGGERGDLYIKVHLYQPFFQKITGGLRRVLHP